MPKLDRLGSSQIDYLVEISNCSFRFWLNKHSTGCAESAGIDNA